MRQPVEAPAVRKPLLRKLDQPGKPGLHTGHRRRPLDESVGRARRDGRGRVNAEQPADLGVLALDVAQLAGQRIGLPVDGLELLVLGGRDRLERLDVLLGQVQLPGVEAQRRSEQGDGGTLFSRRLLRGLELHHGLAVRAGLLTRIDAREHHAVAVARQQRQRIRLVGTDVGEGVVAQEADPRRFALRDLLQRLDPCAQRLQFPVGRGAGRLERVDALRRRFGPTPAQEPVVGAQGGLDRPQPGRGHEKVVAGQNDERAADTGEHGDGEFRQTFLLIGKTLTRAR